MVGVADEHWGEMVVAFVVAAPGAPRHAETVVDACRGTLAGYKVPKRVEFVTALPTNATGKVARGDCAAPRAAG